MTLGNDFTDEEGHSEGEEAEETNPDEQSEEENENSADDANSENEEESEDANESETPEEDEQILAKQKELQGLLDTEKEIGADNSEIDAKIAAARTRISQMRKDRRDKRELVRVVDANLPEEENVDDLADIDPDTIKLLERFTKAKGLVPKSELRQMSYSDAHKTSEKQFFETHPEYLPDNDTDNTLYDAIKSELSDYVAPKDSSKIPELFEKAHREVLRRYPERFSKSTKNEKNNEDIKNASVRIKSQGLGGGTGGGGGKGGSPAKSTKTFSDAQIRAMQEGGWTDEEIKELTNR